MASPIEEFVLLQLYRLGLITFSCLFLCNALILTNKLLIANVGQMKGYYKDKAVRPGGFQASIPRLSLIFFPTRYPTVYCIFHRKTLLRMISYGCWLIFYINCIYALNFTSNHNYFDYPPITDNVPVLRVGDKVNVTYRSGYTTRNLKLWCGNITRPSLGMLPSLH